MGTHSSHGLRGEHERNGQNPLIKLEPIYDGVPDIVVNVYDSHFVVVEPELSSKLEQPSEVKVEAPTTETDFTECGANIKPEPEDEETCPEDILHTHISQPVTNSNIVSSNSHTSLVKQEENNPLVTYSIIVGTNNEISVIKDKNSQKITFSNIALTNCDYKNTISNTTSTQTRINTNNEIYTCNESDHYRTANKYNLKRHKLTHYGEKQHLCQFCDYKGSTARSFKQHMVKHTRDRRYSCDRCDYKCSLKALLVQHTRTHTGEKPFSCPHCNYKCAAPSNLKSHLAIHTGIKCHCCQHCEKKFLRKENLKNHILRLHGKERPLSCHHCEYKCVTKGELIRHLKVNHFR